MAEILLSAAITVLFDRLASSELVNFARKEGIDSKLSKWRKTLFKIQAVLTDAQDKQTTDRAVKTWLDDLQDLAYYLDDVLDEFYTEALRRKVMERPQASTSRVLKFISTCATNFTPHCLMFDHNMRSKIDKISSKLQDISKEKSVLDLKEIKSNKTTNKRLPSTSLVDQLRVYGRDREKEAILELLSSGDDEVSVIPIVGMGGLGKTTLAQLVYNDDDKLKSMGFHLKAWACVSDDFDVFGITKSIIELLTSQPCNLKDLNALQVKLQQTLSGQKFLLVLDDIWNEKYDDWDVLRRPFLGGAQGSKIIVTTRNQRVASMMSTIPAYPLKELENEECLKLFAQHALERCNFDQHQNLKEVGEEIVRRCKGLPLAIKTLGGLLRSKQRRPSEWEDVLNSKIWEFSEQESGILPALQLSYHYLPSHLKQCFAYCSIFPQDYEFDKEELVLLWMAVGLLRPSKGTKSVEDFGREYFDDLLSRSFFQQSSSDKSRFLMHYLINDLAQHIAGEMCFRLEDKANTHEQHNNLFERGRHLSYTRQYYEAFQKFKDFYEVPHLRTFLPLPIYKRYEYPYYHLSNKVLVDLLPKLQCLRVLSLSGYFICELPNSIGELKHLRYLNLSHTSIKWLPDSVCTLYNLQTLLLRGCESLRKLPTSIGDLINLRHLDNAKTGSLEEMPSGIGKVRNLQTLPKIVLGKSNGLSLKVLSDLILLRGRLSIIGLQNVVDIHDAKDAGLKRKHGLDELGLVWSRDFDVCRDEKVEMDVLEMLQPHENLKRLEIKFYGGMKFPTWIGDRSFSKVVEVSLIGCMKCTSLPPLGQLPKLKHLCIEGINKVRSVGVEFYGDGYSLESGFPSLENLSFKDMPEWEKWSHFTGGGEAGGQFCPLSELTISKCPNLVSLPLLQLPSLRKIKLEKCRGAVLKIFADLTSLITLEIDGVTELSCLHAEFMQLSTALEVLKVYECNDLVSVWQNGVVTPPENLVRLKELHVRKCPQLVSLGEEEQGLPCNLEVLELDDCSNLEKLPNWVNSLTSLKKLTIMGCPKLVSLGEEEQGLPCNLEVLGLYDCSNLEKLPNGLNSLTSLKEMRIRNCPKLVYFQETLAEEAGAEISGLDNNSNSKSWLTSLEYLWIDNNQNIRMLFVHSFASLVRSEIRDCGEVESFPEGGLPTPNLRTLFVCDCKKLRCLPDRIQSLASLTWLWIENCKSLESFPNAEFPTNLTSLWISGCEQLKPLSEWGLHRLTSLTHFYLKGGYPKMVCFSDDNDMCLLPPTLTYLSIRGFPNLESISKGLRNLTSLRHLYIRDCPKLGSLPLPQDELWSLSIWGDCPLLKRRCLKDKGDYWPYIAHIPQVEIDHVRSMEYKIDLHHENTTQDLDIINQMDKI